MTRAERDIKTLTVRGATVRVRDTGDPGHAPILLLHGIGRSLEDWAPQHARLSDRYRVISVDLPGFGLSGRMPEPVTVGSLAAGVLATLDVLGERRPMNVMGNSLGGAVAMRMLADAPQRVVTLTLVNSAGFGREVVAYLRVLAVPVLGDRVLSRLDPRAARRVERSLFADPAHATEERVAFALRVAARPEYPPLLLETVRAFGNALGIRAEWRRDLLAQVTKHARPTLIVWGDKDLILPASHMAAARDVFPEARRHLFTGTGHMPQIERADEFATLTRSFFRSHR